ncbi:MAG: cyclic nucleotide-binding domain-containing protein [Gammaproteobacteria bacterium]|nr:cyclic nucleotide-binding domain-containing protein [Gammaproteobacteria bacterium]
MTVNPGVADQPDKTPNATEGLPPSVRELSVFAHLPDANLARIAARLERLECEHDEIVINQGDVGAHYYIIESGECEVLREHAAIAGQDDAARSPAEDAEADAEPDGILLAVLRAGDAFGEEALVSDAPRNATVRMKTDGVLLRLNRTDFVELVKTPLVHYVDPTRAEDLVALGAVWLDVRSPDAHHDNGLERSVNIPLLELRERIDELDHEKTYVVYCENAQPSAAATFLLCERGFAACCLRGGLNGQRPETRTIASGPSELEELGAELIEANEQLEQALQDKAQADAELDVELLSLEADQRDEHARLTERLRALESQAKGASDAFETAKRRKLELERRIREGTAAAAARKRQAQAQLEKLRRDAELRLAAEKQRLQARYKEAAERLQELERERQAVEARFEEERKRLERELEEARAKVENEAKSVREALEGDRRAAEQRAVQIRDAATRAERQLRTETESALKNEQAKLASEFARSVAEQEQARHDLEQAEGARRTAEREVIQVQSAIAAAAERRRVAEAAEREAEQARRRAEEARLRAEREAAEARLIAAEARRQLAEATAKVRSSLTGRPPSSPSDQPQSAVAAAVSAAIGQASGVADTPPQANAQANAQATARSSDSTKTSSTQAHDAGSRVATSGPEAGPSSEPPVAAVDSDSPAPASASTAPHGETSDIPAEHAVEAAAEQESGPDEQTPPANGAGSGPATPTTSTTTTLPATVVAEQPEPPAEAAPVAAANPGPVTDGVEAAPEGTGALIEDPVAAAQTASSSDAAVAATAGAARPGPAAPGSKPARGSNSPLSGEISIDDLEEQLAAARQAVEEAIQEEERFAREEKTAAVSRAKEEELRLRLFEEMENWVEEERERSERDHERYVRELERLQQAKEARRKQQRDVDEGLIADLQSVLSRAESDEDPFDEFIRMRTMAEETSRVVQDAKAALEAQRAESEKALAEANARLDEARQADSS